MKRHLGLITAIGLVATTGSTVIACNTKENDSLSKKALKKLIDEVTPVVRDYRGKRDTVEFSRLSTALSSARSCHYSNKSKDSDYIKSYFTLNEALKEFQNPGYKAEKENLIRFIDMIVKYINENSWRRKTPKVIFNLQEALREAREVLDYEVDPTTIKLTKQKLEFYFDEYCDDDGKSIFES